MDITKEKSGSKMSFGQNLQFLRKMQGGMTQEELAEKLGVSRQTVSKWELDTAYPEISKVIELCSLFSCTMDQLIREDMTLTDKAYSNIRFEWVEAFRYLPYAVISREPEDDAKAHVKNGQQPCSSTPRRSSAGISRWSPRSKLTSSICKAMPPP